MKKKYLAKVDGNTKKSKGHPFLELVGYFGAPWLTFCILQAVRCGSQCDVVGS